MDPGSQKLLMELIHRHFGLVERLQADALASSPLGNDERLDLWDRVDDLQRQIEALMAPTEDPLPPLT